MVSLKLNFPQKEQFMNIGLLFLKRKILTTIVFTMSITQLSFAQLDWDYSVDNSDFDNLVVKPLDQLVNTGISGDFLTRIQLKNSEYERLKAENPDGFHENDLPKLNFLFVPNYKRRRMRDLPPESQLVYRGMDYTTRQLMAYNNPKVGTQKIVEFIDSHKKYIETDPVLARDIFHKGFQVLFDYALKTKSKFVYHVLFSQSYRYQELILECGYCFHANTVFNQIAILAESEFERLFLTPEERITKYLILLEKLPKEPLNDSEYIKSSYDYKGTPDFVKFKYAMDNLLQIFLDNPDLQTIEVYERISKIYDHYLNVFRGVFFYSIYSKRYLYMHMYGYREYNKAITNLPLNSFIKTRLQFRYNQLIDGMEINLEAHWLFGSYEYPYSHVDRITKQNKPTSNELHDKFKKFKGLVNSKTNNLRSVESKTNNYDGIKKQSNISSTATLKCESLFLN